MKVRTLVMLLAGGRGTRLNILGAHRAKPAVPFGGLYRIIDFALSNCMYGRLQSVGVLTQYRPISLLNHLGNGRHWDMDGKMGLLKNLPPYQASADFDWYHGTADAVWQNLNFIRRYRPEHVLVLSGDHIYQMDYRRMVEHHRANKSALTLAAMRVPDEETHRFGIIVPDKANNVVEFQEKPRQARSNLASMGIYIFDTKVLIGELERMAAAAGTDFGKDVIPGMLGRFPINVYPFEGYWRDVGTIDSYFLANMDLLRHGSGIDPFVWRPRTNLDYMGVVAMPPARVDGGSVTNSFISPGCVVRGEVRRSILSPGVVVEKGAMIVDSIVMHRSVISNGAQLERAIIDKNCVVGAGARVGRQGSGVANRATPEHLSSGLVVTGRLSQVPEGAVVGNNVIIQPGVTAADYPGAQVEDGATIEAGNR